MAGKKCCPNCSFKKSISAGSSVVAFFGEEYCGAPECPCHKTITVERDFFEHLLACLANQKFIGENPPNGDALAEGKEVYESVQRRNQKIIDEAWEKGMDLLN